MCLIINRNYPESGNEHVFLNECKKNAPLVTFVALVVITVITAQLLGNPIFSHDFYKNPLQLSFFIGVAGITILTIQKIIESIFICCKRKEEKSPTELTNTNSQQA